MMLALALLVASSTLSTPLPAPPATDRLWQPVDALAARGELRQQDLPGPFSSNCNWIRVVEVGQGRPVGPVDAVTIRVRGYATKAGSAHWDRRIAEVPPQTLKVLLGKAGLGLQTALTGVRVGSAVHLVVLPHLANPIAEQVLLPRGPTQLHLLIEVVDARD